MPTRMSETSRKRMECIRESIIRAQKQIDRYRRQDDVRKGCDVTSELLKSEISYNMAPADGGKKERAERNKFGNLLLLCLNKFGNLFFVLFKQV